MNTFPQSKWLFIKAGVLGMALLGTAACGMLMSHGVERPKADEFGMGPRHSVLGIYTATLVSEKPVQLRNLQTLRVVLTDSQGTAVDGATITVDGGMPQHGHGLPTRPKITKNFDGGIYEINGVRFNMGGWWEFKLAVTSPQGDDTVTFNLDL